MTHASWTSLIRTALVLASFAAFPHSSVAQPDTATQEISPPAETRGTPQTEPGTAGGDVGQGDVPDQDAGAARRNDGLPPGLPDWMYTDEVFRMGSDYTLRAGQEAREVVVISGDARIEGLVHRDVVVILGSADLTSTAEIRGALVVIGGRVAVSQGARVDRDFVVVGGTVNAGAGFEPGGEEVIIGTEALGVSIEPVVPWVQRGLLWGRPIVPDLDWVWPIVGFWFVAYLLVNALFDRPVQACARTLVDRPLTSLGVGLLGLLLVGPVLLLLAVSVIGIVVIPFAICALLLAWILGKVGVTRAIGLTMIGDARERNGGPARLQATVAFVIGFVVLCIAYMVPIVGLLTWAMVGVIGFGAAGLAFVSGYRRENPANGYTPAGASPGPPPPPYTTGATPPVPLAPPVQSPTNAGVTSAAPQHAPAASHVAAAMPAPPIVTEAPPAAPAPAAPVPPAPEAQPAVPPPPPAPGVPSGLLSFRRAYFSERLAAFVLDVLLVAITLSLVTVVGPGERGLVLLLLIYYVGFWTWRGTSVGGLICQIRVVRTTGVPLEIGDAFIRGLTGMLSLAALGLGGFWILIDKDRQAWHDKVAGTYVVKVPKGWEG